MSAILIFKGSNPEKFACEKNPVMMNHNLRPNHASDKKTARNRPPFFPKMGVCFLQDMVWPKITIRWHATILCVEKITNYP